MERMLVKREQESTGNAKSCATEKRGENISKMSG
jgi:hypothetical protein